MLFVCFCFCCLYIWSHTHRITDQTNIWNFLPVFSSSSFKILTNLCILKQSFLRPPCCYYVFCLHYTFSILNTASSETGKLNFDLRFTTLAEEEINLLICIWPLSFLVLLSFMFAHFFICEYKENFRRHRTDYSVQSKLLLLIHVKDSCLIFL